MQFHDFVIGMLAFLSEMIGTISGFGSSTFFMPSAIYFEPFRFVMALTAILHVFGNSSKLFLFREGFDGRIFLLLAVPSITLTVVGAIFASYIDANILKKCLGMALIFLSFTFLIGAYEKRKFPMWLVMILSGFSGLSTGLVGTGGAIRGVALSALGVQKNTFVVMSAAIDFFGDLLRMIIYLVNGFMDWSQWFYVPLLGLMALLGAHVGKTLLEKMKPEHFEKTVAIFIFLGGIGMLL